MNKETRIKKLEEIRKGEPFMIQEIPWKGKLEKMNVYKVPLEYLVYNKYNGRILSRTKSLEKQNYKIDADTDEGKKIIADLLWDSKVDRNRKTLQDIYDFEQQKVGIITKDGIIVDGNRRVMLLNKILENPKYSKKYNYFKAVILPVALEDDPLEIEELETKFQMGEDEKLGYNPTEKYLKAKEIYLKITKESIVDLKNLNAIAVQKIADWMGESISEVEKYLNTIAVMDDYLDYLGVDGIYTQLDSREDQFLSLQKWLNAFYGTESRRGFDGYEDLDVDDLKHIAFDYIRIRNYYDGKDFRYIAEGNRENHFFGDEKIWKTFTKRHFNIIDRMPEEPEIDFDSNDLKSHLDARDKEFFNNSKFDNEDSAFIENLKERITDIGYAKAKDQPRKLINRASQALDAINVKHSAFNESETQYLVQDLADKVIKTMSGSTPLRVLQQTLKMLESIDVEKVSDSEIDEIRSVAKEISSLCYKKFMRGL